MTDPFIFVIIIAIVSIVVFVAILFFNKKALVKRKLKKAGQTKISEFRSGDVAKLVGRVVFAGEPLIAPLSGRKCSMYYVHVQEKVTSGKSHHWVTRIKEEVWSKFLIKEGEKYAFINEKNLKCYIVQDANYRSGFMNDASPKLEKYLARKSYKSENFMGLNRSFRYREGVLENDEQIAVFGKGVWKDASQLKLPETYGKVLEITSNNDEAVYISDDPATTKRKVMDRYESRRKLDDERRYRK